MHNGTHENFSIIHLQRLANPALVWNATTNPYITIDCMPVDLVVVNTNGAGGGNNNLDELGNYRQRNNLELSFWRTGRTTMLMPQLADELGRTVERGGKISASGRPDINGPDTNQWSRRVDAASTDLEDAESLS